MNPLHGLGPQERKRGYAQTAEGMLNATKVPTGSLHSLEGSDLVLQTLYLSCLGLTLQQAQYEDNMHFPSCPLVSNLKKKTH